MQNLAPASEEKGEKLVQRRKTDLWVGPALPWVKTRAPPQRFFSLPLNMNCNEDLCRKEGACHP